MIFRNWINKILSSLTFYYKVRLIIDYISGMTDNYALEEYKVLSAIK